MKTLQEAKEKYGYERGRESSRMLINENYLSVQPSLVMALGSLSEAVVLQQIQFLLTMKKAGADHGGHHWIYNTYEELAEDHFPFWGSKNVKKIILRLKKKGVLITSQPEGNNRRNHYRIDYDTLDSLVNSHRLRMGPINAYERGPSTPTNGGDVYTEYPTEYPTDKEKEKDKEKQKPFSLPQNQQPNAQPPHPDAPVTPPARKVALSSSAPPPVPGTPPSSNTPRGRRQLSAIEYMKTVEGYGLKKVDGRLLVDEVLKVCGKYAALEADLPGSEKQLYRAWDTATHLLAAGIRTPQHVRQLEKEVISDWPTLKTVSFGHLEAAADLIIEGKRQPVEKIKIQRRG